MIPRVSSGFVGRRDELGELSACLDGAVAGSGRLVVVAGEGGVGKTRLCEELSVVAARAGVGVAWAVCPESGGLAPFWPWWQFLDQIGAGFDPVSVGEDAPDVARARLFAAVIGALRAAALVRPWLLVLDDLQWVDPASLRLLDHVGPLLRSSAVLVLATLRQSDIAASSLPSGLSGLLRNVRTLWVGGLPLGELGELVQELAGSRPDPGVTAALHRATAGNPLFAACCPPPRLTT